MARKIGKNSRNARQAAGLFDEPDVESLNDLPRAEKTDLSNILIRTAAKNEALLDAKIKKKRGDNKKRIGKKSLEDRLAKSITQMDKDRLTKALNISNRLDGKISRSIARAKYVQTSRKAGWDATNQAIRKELDHSNIDGEKTKKKNDEDADMENDEDLEQPFMEEEEEAEKEKAKKDNNKSVNMFALLDAEVEE